MKSDYLYKHFKNPNTMRININLTQSIHDAAKKYSKDLLGEENVSKFITYLVAHYNAARSYTLSEQPNIVSDIVVRVEEKEVVVAPKKGIVVKEVKNNDKVAVSKPLSKIVPVNKKDTNPTFDENDITYLNEVDGGIEKVDDIPEPTTENFSSVPNKTKFSFKGKICTYIWKGKEETLEVTDDMITLGQMQGVSQRTFSRYPNPMTYNITMAYLETVKNLW
jgi:hypothetical protein